MIETTRKAEAIEAEWRAATEAGDAATAATLRLAVLDASRGQGAALNRATDRRWPAVEAGLTPGQLGILIRRRS